MKTIFEQGEFDRYRVQNLNEARGIILETSQYAQAKPTVFLSHKHDELNDLKGVIGLLEQQFRVKVYIDSRDPSMPATTSGETAKRIKDRIVKCNKFILLATNGAIESKWCNWELGYGDARKLDYNNLAIFPMKPKGSFSAYAGNEYLSIYPSIAYYDGTERYRNGTHVSEGYYVRNEKNGEIYITRLYDWLHR